MKKRTDTIVPKRRDIKIHLVQAFAVLLVLLNGCGKPEQFPQILEDPKGVIRDTNCSSSACLSLGADQPAQFVQASEEAPGVIRDKNCQSGTRVAIISHSTLDVKYLPLTIDNHRRYARHFGYDYIFRNNLLTTKFVDEYAKSKVFQLGLYWQKIQALQDAMNEMDGNERRYDWLLWIDADALFTNFDVSIQNKVQEHAGEFANPTHYFLASRENFSLINAGVMLFHNDEAGRKMVNSIEAAFKWYAPQTLPEQDAISDYIAGFLTERGSGNFYITPVMERNYKDPNLLIKGTKVLPQRALNSFYGGWWPWSTGPDVVWEPGDFIAHFAVVKDKGRDIANLVKCFRDKGGADYEKNDAYKSCT